MKEKINGVTSKSASRCLAGAFILLSIVTVSQPVVLSDRSVILTPQQGPEAIFRGFQEPEPKLTGYWMPTAADARELEKHLPAFIRQNTPIRRAILRDFRQYAGFEAGKKRFIFIDGFWLEEETPGVEWKTRPIIWGGGGESVWHVEYNVETKEFKHFATGGPL